MISHVLGSNTFIQEFNNAWSAVGLVHPVTIPRKYGCINVYDIMLDPVAKIPSLTLADQFTSVVISSADWNASTPPVGIGAATLFFRTNPSKKSTAVISLVCFTVVAVNNGAATTSPISCNPLSVPISVTVGGTEPGAIQPKTLSGKPV